MQIYIALAVMLSAVWISALKNLEWNFWLKIFIITCFADAASTFLGVYVYQADWSREINPFVHQLAAYFGYDAALILQNVVLILIFYPIAWLFGRLSKYLSISMLAFLSYIKLLAAVHNTVLPLEYATRPIAWLLDLG